MKTECTGLMIAPPGALLFSEPSTSRQLCHQPENSGKNMDVRHTGSSPAEAPDVGFTPQLCVDTAGAICQCSVVQALTCE
jgi:hypothetical protein